MGLAERVLFHLEGVETKFVYDMSGRPVYIEKTFGPDRWIERAAAGRMTALDLLAIILFCLEELRFCTNARAIVRGWHSELRRAVEAGEVTPRDPSSLLPCRADFDGLGWVVSRVDAAQLLTRNQIGIDLDVVIEHLLKESIQEDAATIYDPETGVQFGKPVRNDCLPSRIEPVEWCEMLCPLAAEDEQPPEPTSSASAPAATDPEPVAPSAVAVEPDSASAPASAPEPVAGTAGADKEKPIDRARRLADRVEHWKRQGVRDYTARVADEERLSVERVRQILQKLKPVTRPKKNKPRQKATFCSGLIQPASRTR